MSTHSLGSWQFSLRGLLYLTLGIALVLGVAAALGSNWFYAPLIALVLLPILGFSKGLTRKAFFLAASALYGPFIAMAAGTSLWISCSHCKAAAWQVLPFGPAILPYELARQILSLPHFSTTAGMATMLLLAGLMLAVATLLVRRFHGWVQGIILSVSIAYSGFAAMCVLAAIRS